MASPARRRRSPATSSTTSKRSGYLSAEELGRKGSTSSSTVVRFAQSLGFAGLSRAAEGGPRRIPAGRHGPAGRARRPARLLHRGRHPHPLAQDRRPQPRRDHQQEHAGALQPGRCTCWPSARQVLVVGLHEAAVVAEHASYVFELLGIPCLAVTDSTESNVARLSRLGAGDVLLAIGFRRAHSVTISFAEKAAEQGATVVVITDNSLSELAGQGRPDPVRRHRLHLLRPLARGSHQSGERAGGGHLQPGPRPVRRPGAGGARQGGRIGLAALA